MAYKLIGAEAKELVKNVPLVSSSGFDLEEIDSVMAVLRMKGSLACLEQKTNCNSL
jgi:hypothetical protein